METERVMRTSRAAGSRRRTWGFQRTRRRWLLSALGLLALFGLIQLVPFGRGANPPVSRAAAWPAGPGLSLARKACYDCHSNLTKRWWATEVAPVSWLVQHDVNDGRARLNFSRWDTAQAPREQVVDAVLSGSMPPVQYKLVHGDARLDTRERRQLADAISRLYAADPPAGVRWGGD
jgi:hypothetical protein